MRFPGAKCMDRKLGGGCWGRGVGVEELCSGQFLFAMTKKLWSWVMILHLTSPNCTLKTG